MSFRVLGGLLTLTLGAGFALPAGGQEILPFPPNLRAAQPRVLCRSQLLQSASFCEPLSKDAPNILIVFSMMLGLPKRTLTAGKSTTRR